MLAQGKPLVRRFSRHIMGTSHPPQRNDICPMGQDKNRTGHEQDSRHMQNRDTNAVLYRYFAVQNLILYETVTHETGQDRIQGNTMSFPALYFPEIKNVDWIL